MFCILIKKKKKTYAHICMLNIAFISILSYLIAITDDYDKIFHINIHEPY